jgi:hypothetical protein
VNDAPIGELVLKDVLGARHHRDYLSLGDFEVIDPLITLLRNEVCEFSGLYYPGLIRVI